MDDEIYRQLERQKIDDENSALDWIEKHAPEDQKQRLFTWARRHFKLIISRPDLPPEKRTAADWCRVPRFDVMGRRIK